MIHHNLPGLLNHPTDEKLVPQTPDTAQSINVELRTSEINRNENASVSKMNIMVFNFILEGFEKRF